MTFSDEYDFAAQDAALTAATRRAKAVALCFVLGLVIVAGCAKW